MRARCSAPCYKDSIYQKKGITVCQRWDSFENFISDMGPCPESYSIDRINTNGNYSPENCRWASAAVQAKNRGSFNKVYTYNGETYCLKDWAKVLGIKYITLVMRIKRHPELSFTEVLSFIDPRIQPIVYENKEYTRQELCEKFNIPLKLFYDRWHKQWPLERILKTPINK